MHPSACEVHGGSHQVVRGATTASSSAKTETSFGDTEVVEAKRTHLATIVWLHGLGDNSTRLSLSVQLPLSMNKVIGRRLLYFLQTRNRKLQHGCSCLSVLCNLLHQWYVCKWQTIPDQIE
ncbi:hypothetical protein R3W88_029580 [Solanum pinnatisectum]|uniref:Phospholipase/carboxylesterase/thioesterase domain-containing protein n=1 Tax=Solanum pinnatisectum TaxID=50273 RepID=A0AAV9K5Q1_9SOLN|nr:hypothetical protein R3W88_029580 [Solanum pinnatisectum]